MSQATTPLNGQVEQTLKEEIVTGQYALGEKVDMHRISKRLGVSVTPVRDALRRLESAGFVTVAPRHGIYVSVPDQQTFKDVFSLRIALECLAVESAVETIPEVEIRAVMEEIEEACKALDETGDRGPLIRSDEVVHDLVLQNCGNRKLVEMIESLGDHIRWTRSVITKVPLTYEAAVPEHLLILNALRLRDAESAKAAMRSHLKNSFNRSRLSWEDSDAIGRRPDPLACGQGDEGEAT